MKVFIIVPCSLHCRTESWELMPFLWKSLPFILFSSFIPTTYGKNFPHQMATAHWSIAWDCTEKKMQVLLNLLELIGRNRLIVQKQDVVSELDFILLMKLQDLWMEVVTIYLIEFVIELIKDFSSFKDFFLIFKVLNFLIDLELLQGNLIRIFTRI